VIVMLFGKRLRELLPRMAFVIWIPAVLVPSSYLLARHVVTLPKPAAADPALVDSLRNLRGVGDAGMWMTLHVLYGECGCSQKVLTKLLLRSPRRNMRERIVFIGSENDDSVRSKATALGYAFELVTREQLVERYHLEAAPLLVVADPADRIQYVGGYTDRKQGQVIRDDEVLDRLVAGRVVEALPTFGCAVSKKLQSAVDPLGLR
jgi:hypothetical protein